MTTATTTTDHDAIRKWAEARDGRPARVQDTAHGGGGLLRIDFNEPEERAGRNFLGRVFSDL